MSTDLVMDSIYLCTKAGTRTVLKISAPGWDGKVRIIYWILIKGSDRMTPVETFAIYCPVHILCYLEDDFPRGCPQCTKVIHQHGQ